MRMWNVIDHEPACMNGAATATSVVMGRPAGAARSAAPNPLRRAVARPVRCRRPGTGSSPPGEGVYSALQ